jgi:hypothetical protein
MNVFDEITGYLSSMCKKTQLIEIVDNIGGTRCVRALSTKEFSAQDIHAMRDDVLRRYSMDEMLLIIHLERVVDFSIEEKVMAAMSGRPLKTELFFNIWVVDDDNLETQLKMLDVLGYPNGSDEMERVAECKDLLLKIYKIVRFKIWKINPLLGALFCEKPTIEQSLEIAEIVVPFLEKYGDAMYSGIKAHAKALRSMEELQM